MAITWHNRHNMSLVLGLALIALSPSSGCGGEPAEYVGGSAGTAGAPTGGGGEDGCRYAGRFFPVGSAVPSLDCCNSCTCSARELVTCTAIACNQATGRGCEVGGVRYANGATGIPDPVSCNSCTCEDGKLTCSQLACPLPCRAGTTFGTSCASCSVDAPELRLDAACQVFAYDCYATR